jgi:hypothetical protein
MTPILFAVVDAVLCGRIVQAYADGATLAAFGLMAGEPRNRAARWTATLGWWRSCWPL